MNWYKIASVASLSYVSYNIWKNRKVVFLNVMRKSAEVQIVVNDIIEKIKPLIPEKEKKQISKIIEISGDTILERESMIECNIDNACYIYWNNHKYQEFIYFKKKQTIFDSKILEDTSEIKSNILSATILNKNGQEIDISDIIRKYEGPKRDFNINSEIKVKDLLNNNGLPIFQENDKLVIINCMADILEFTFHDTLKL
jgi:hypothetical protein